MYAVSDKFKQAIKNPNRKSSIHGTLTTVNGKKYALNDSNIIKDSLYVTNQIVNESKLCFGAVYAGECGLVINSNIDRYSLFGAEIKLFFSIELDDGTSEEVPLGVFYVDTPERIGSKIKLIAVDSMSKFDVEVDEDVNGTVYELVSYIAEKCGVELAQTQEEIEALNTNALNQYFIQHSRIDTYREALSYLAMIICSNATIDRNGKLKLVQYATSSCDSNDRNSRLNSCKFSDYTTRYAGITARFIAEENYSRYEKYGEDADGLLLDCGDIPIVSGTPAVKNAILGFMYDTLKEIAYTPATLYISSNPAYDLGDMIECKNVNNSSHAVNTYVMAYTYDYRKKQTLHCYGENPLLKNVKDKTERFRNEVEGQITSKELIIVSYTNAGILNVSDKEMTVITMLFSTGQNARPIFIGVVPFNMDVDGNVIVRYYLDEVLIADDTLTEYLHSGQHFLTFSNNFNLKEGRTYKLKVTLQTEMIESDFRKHNSKIVSILDYINRTEPESVYTEQPIDTTVPTLTIPKFGIKAIVYAQGLATLGDWDGTLNFADEVEPFTIAPCNITVVDFAEQLAIKHMTRNDFEVSDVISIEFPQSIAMVDLKDVMEFSTVVKLYEVRTFDEEKYDYDKSLVTHNGFFGLNTEYEFESAEETIDSGRMTVLKIKTDDKASVEGLVIE